LSLAEKSDVLKKYDDLPEMSQRRAACKLNVSHLIGDAEKSTRMRVQIANEKGTVMKRKSKRL